MNRIKFVLFITIMLLFVACSFGEKVSQTHVGTINMIKQKKISGFIGGDNYKYKLEITTSEGIILKGKYEDAANKYRLGDFVKVTIYNDKIEKIEILPRNIINNQF